MRRERSCESEPTGTLERGESLTWLKTNPFACRERRKMCGEGRSEGKGRNKDNGHFRSR